MAKGRKPVKQEILDNIDLIKKYRRDGHSVKKIAEAIGVSQTSIKNYAKKIPEVQIALDTDKEKHQLLLEDSLIYQASRRTKERYEYDYVYNRVKDDWEWRPSKKIIEDYTPPIQSIIFALKNFDSTRWKDKIENDIKINEEDEKITAIHDFLDEVTKGDE